MAFLYTEYPRILSGRTQYLYCEQSLPRSSEWCKFEWPILCYLSAAWKSGTLHNLAQKYPAPLSLPGLVHLAGEKVPAVLYFSKEGQGSLELDRMGCPTAARNSLGEMSCNPSLWENATSDGFNVRVGLFKMDRTLSVTLRETYRLRCLMWARGENSPAFIWKFKYFLKMSQVWAVTGKKDSFSRPGDPVVKPKN